MRERGERRRYVDGEGGGREREGRRDGRKINNVRPLCQLHQRDIAAQGLEQYGEATLVLAGEASAL